MSISAIDGNAVAIFDEATNGTKEFKITDHLGSARVALKEGGASQEWDFEPYGTPVAGDGPRKGFIDKEVDDESNLGDFGVRKYDSDIGRFMSIDPLWEKYRAWTPYQYGVNSPIIYTDPTGKTVEPKNLDEARTEIFEAIIEHLQKWESEITQQILQDALGPDSEIHLYVLNKSGAETRTTTRFPTRIGPTIEENFAASLGPGMTLHQREGKTIMEGDVAIDDGIFDSWLWDDPDAEPGTDPKKVWNFTSIAAITLLDELMHSTNLGDADSYLDHRNLYVGLYNEMKSGKLNVPFGAERQITLKAQKFLNSENAKNQTLDSGEE